MSYDKLKVSVKAYVLWGITLGLLDVIFDQEEDSKDSTWVKHHCREFLEQLQNGETSIKMLIFADTYIKGLLEEKPLSVSEWFTVMPCLLNLRFEIQMRKWLGEPK